MPLPDEAEKQPPKLIEYEGSIEWACYRLRHASGAAIIMPRLEGVQIGHAMPNDDDDHEWFFPAWVEDPPLEFGRIFASTCRPRYWCENHTASILG